MSMAPTATNRVAEQELSETLGEDSRTAILRHGTAELIFAVVGHVGSGTSTVAESLKALLEAQTAIGGYDVIPLKAREVISAWGQSEGKEMPLASTNELQATIRYQDLGDEMRRITQDNSAVARRLIAQIRLSRARKTGASPTDEGPVKPDGKKRAYILESIRHPAEVHLLRHLYQDAFILIGIVCEEERRLSRIMRKYKDAGEINAKAFMERDAKAQEEHGQHVSDAFHLSDFFLDNTVERFEKSGEESKFWDINEKLRRLVKIIGHSEVVRPEVGETAMFHAYGVAMRSACLSRQVGAALVDATGNVVATGTNEVPRAGGGVYGETFDSSSTDYRCAYKKGMVPYCSNTKQQNELVETLVERIVNSYITLKSKELTDSHLPTKDTLIASLAINPIQQNTLRKETRNAGVGDLLEYSRAVHAEMDALLSAGRDGTTTRGTRLFVTTFPCHYCARHIVSAGVDEVQFIEPYPKSKALKLHSDSIQVEATAWEAPSKGGARVLFRPFVGVAPRLYRRAFHKDRELKNRDTGDFHIGEPKWGAPWHLRGAAYVDLEALLAKAIR